MRERKIYITELDRNRLTERLLSPEAVPEIDQDNLAELEQELLRAEIVPAREIPGDVITMNSTGRVRDRHTRTE